MRYALIDDGVVVNIILAAPDFDAGITKVELGDMQFVSVGDTYDGTQFVKPTPPMPTLEDYDAALTAHLDSVAQTKRYADRISCSVRAGYPGPFHAEGVAFAQWMDACNAAGYAILEDFQAGRIPQPTVAEVIATLPVMVWPA